LAVVVGGDKSTTLRRRLETVPELVACEAEVGSSMCTEVWLDMVMLEAFENEGFRIAELAAPSSSWAPERFLLIGNSGSGFSSVGDSLSRGVGAKDELAFEVSEL
jgi:hypothetical protein